MLELLPIPISHEATGKPGPSEHCHETAVSWVRNAKGSLGEKPPS